MLTHRKAHLHKLQISRNVLSKPNAFPVNSKQYISECILVCWRQASLSKRNSCCQFISPARESQNLLRLSFKQADCFSTSINTLLCLHLPAVDATSRQLVLSTNLAFSVCGCDCCPSSLPSAASDSRVCVIFFLITNLLSL